jgi:hypothetical protein
MNKGALVGLIIFLIGLLLLVIWAFDMSGRVSILVPGLLCAGGGFVIMYIFGRNK